MYKVAAGHNIAEVSMEPVVPQPRSQGVRSARRSYAASGAVHEDNFYVELEWDALDEDGYSAILTQFGLGSSYTARVTITVPEIDYDFNRFNGTAIRPALGEDVKRQNFFVRGITLLIRDLSYAT